MSNLENDVHRKVYLKKEELKQKRADLEDRLSFSWLLTDKEERNLRRELGRVVGRISRLEVLSRQVL